MEDGKYVDEIPVEVAVMLCDSIRAEADKNWHTAAARWCWECRQSAEGDPAKRGFLRAPGNRGCYLVNMRYVSLQKSKSE